MRNVKINFDNLGYLTTEELWKFMRDLKIPYCEIEDVEKENLETGEKTTVPKFVPRTDYDNMKSDIVIGLMRLNYDGRRKISMPYKKLIEKRQHQEKLKNLQGDVNG